MTDFWWAADTYSKSLQGFKEQIYDVYRYLPPQIQVGMRLGRAESKIEQAVFDLCVHQSVLILGWKHSALKCISSA
jgi:hypothetical protein